MVRWLVSLILITAIGGGVYYFVQKDSPAQGKNAMNLGVVKRLDLSQRVNISGAVTPNKSVIFVPPYEGYIRKIYVKLGESVKAGQPVVQIAPGGDDESFPLRAPFDGVVVQVLRNEGQYVEKNKTDTIVRIDDISVLFIESDAPELDYAKLKIGQEVVVKASALMDRTFKGRISEISQAARGQERWERSKVEFPIKVEILDKDPRLKPGMSAVIDVIIENAPGALTLRHEFIRKDGEEYWVTMEDGSRRKVTVGLRNEEAFEIKDGLSEGEKVRQVDFLSM